MAVDDSYTKLLCHFAGSDGAVKITDESGKGKGVAVGGNAKIKTDQYKLGSSSAYFDGASDWLQVAPGIQWEMGAGDFTIECFFRIASAVSGTLVAYRQQSSAYGAFDMYLSSGKLALVCAQGSSFQVNIMAASAASSDTWHHAAAVRYGNIFTIYLDGVAVATTTQSITLNALTHALSIGALNNSNEPYTGYIDEARVSKGIARWTTDFTPPSSAYSTDDYTMLLMHMEGSDISTVFIDDSGKLSVYANAAIKTAQYKFGASSLGLDGTGDFISAPSSADFDFGSGDFTIDGWFYPNTVATTYQGLCGRRVAAANYGPFSMGLNTNKLIVSLSLNGSSWAVYTTGGTISATAWHHFALVRNGTSIKAYLDGTSVIDTTLTGSLCASTANVAIGDFANDVSTPLNGYIDEFRISNGIARWTADFTPPTTEYAPSEPGGSSIILACFI